MKEKSSSPLSEEDKEKLSLYSTLQNENASLKQQNENLRHQSISIQQSLQNLENSKQSMENSYKAMQTKYIVVSDELNELHEQLQHISLRYMRLFHSIYSSNDSTIIHQLDMNEEELLQGFNIDDSTISDDIRKLLSDTTNMTFYEKESYYKIQLNVYQQRVEKIKLQFKKGQEDIQSLKNSINELNKAIDNKNSIINQFETTILSNLDKNSDLVASIKNLFKEYLKENTEHSTLKKKIDDLQETVRRLQFEKERYRLTIQDNNNEISSLKKEKEQLQSSTSLSIEDQTKINDYEREINQLTIQIQSNDREMAFISESNDELQKRWEYYGAIFNQVQEFDRLLHQLANVNSSLNEQQQMNEFEKQCQSLLDTIQAMNSNQYKELELAHKENLQWKERYNHLQESFEVLKSEYKRFIQKFDEAVNESKNSKVLADQYKQKLSQICETQPKTNLIESFSIFVDSISKSYEFVESTLHEMNKFDTLLTDNLSSLSHHPSINVSSIPESVLDTQSSSLVNPHDMIDYSMILDILSTSNEMIAFYNQLPPCSYSDESEHLSQFFTSLVQQFHNFIDQNQSCMLDIKQLTHDNDEIRNELSTLKSINDSLSLLYKCLCDRLNSFSDSTTNERLNSRSNFHPQPLLQVRFVCSGYIDEVLYVHSSTSIWKTLQYLSYIYSLPHAVICYYQNKPIELKYSYDYYGYSVCDFCVAIYVCVFSLREK